MKYYVIIYQSLVKTSNDLNEKSSKNGSARNMLSNISPLACQYNQCLTKVSPMNCTNKESFPTRNVRF